jgi:hypothetical protein
VTRGLQRLTAAAHPADAVLRWTEQAAADLEASGYATGCPIATVVLETAHTSDVLAEAGSTAFAAWRDALAAGMVRHGATEAEARALAVVVLAGVEGGLLLARAARTPARCARWPPSWRPCCAPGSRPGRRASPVRLKRLPAVSTWGRVRP